MMVILSCMLSKCDNKLRIPCPCRSIQTVVVDRKRAWLQEYKNQVFYTLCCLYIDANEDSIGNMNKWVKHIQSKYTVAILLIEKLPVLFVLPKSSLFAAQVCARTGTPNDVDIPASQLPTKTITGPPLPYESLTGGSFYSRTTNIKATSEAGTQSVVHKKNS